MGTLAAVAIPAYNQYRENAARAAFDSTGANVAKAFQSCVAVNPFSDCNDLSKINIACNACTGVEKAQPKFCVNMKTEIGGDDFKGCVSTDAGTGAVTRTIKGGTAKFCYDDSGSTTPPCSAGFEASCDSIQSPFKECAAATDCGSGNHCETANGTCDTTAATCT